MSLAARRRPGVLSALAVGTMVLAGCAAERTTEAVPTPTAGTAGFVVPDAEPQVVASGLTTPWSVAFVDDAALVSERDTGRILEIVGDRTRVVAEVPDVAAAGEGGLLGIAHAEGFLYAYVTTPEGNRVVRFALEGAPGSFALGEVETVLDGIPSANIHNGGRLAFGPYGMLYITAGDAADPGAAQDASSLGGKILRVTPEGEVPADNPFPDSPVWSLGHRNPQGIGWDAEGTMFASEFGQNTFDELNVIRPGANYGWPEVEGRSDDPDFHNPIAQWSTDEASPSGIAHAEGSIWMVGLRGQRLWRIPLKGTEAAAEPQAFLEGEYGRLRTVVPAGGDKLWVVTSNTDGRGDPEGTDDRILEVQVQ